MFSQAMGSDGPVIEVFFPARDAADYYAQAAKNDAMLGDELQALLSELLPLCRRLEQSDWTRRPDLDYRPTN